MQIALYKNSTIYADGALYEYGKGKDYICPCCNEKVILNAGAIKYPYFSHRKGTKCVDDIKNEMSEWHRYCQSLFPKENREVIITRKVKEIFPDDEEYEDDDETITHIADICYKNYVIEFQHSPMNPDTFDERTNFYLQAGYKLIWVFDWNDKYWNDYLNPYWCDNNSCKWELKYAPKTCMYYMPQRYIKNLMICFSYNELIEEPSNEEIGDSTLERIVWARPDNDDYTCANYSRIVTRNLNNVVTINDLAEFILNK